MSATLTDVAAAVVDELNAQDWSLELTAARVPVVNFDLADLATVQVPVVAVSSDSEPDTRALRVKVSQIDVGVLVRVDPTNDGIDPYLALVDEIADHFHQRQLAGIDAPTLCLVGRPDPIYDVERLEQHRVFFAVIRLEFRTWLPA